MIVPDFWLRRDYSTTRAENGPTMRQLPSAAVSAITTAPIGGSEVKIESKR
jgi:hypothetical protein